MRKCGVASRRMVGQKILQIVCTHKGNSYLRHISDSFGKAKQKKLSNYSVNNEIRYYLRYIFSNQIPVMLLYWRKYIFLENWTHAIHGEPEKLKV